MGQALRDAIKTRRASGKKLQAAKGVKKVNSDPSGLKTNFLKEQPTRFPSANHSMMQEGRDLLKASAANKMFAEFNNNHSLSSGLQLTASTSMIGSHHHQMAQQSFEGSHSNNVYFDNQLFADLEPNPFQSQSATMELPDLFGRVNMASASSGHDSTTSSHLRFYDIDGRRASITHILNGDSTNREISSDTGHGEKLPAPRLNSLGPFHYEQQMLPSVIERRRHSLVGPGIDGDLSYHPIIGDPTLTPPFLSLKNEFKNKVDSRLSRGAGAHGHTDSSSQWDDILGRITSHEV